MDRIEALKHVLQDKGFSQEEKTSALAALRDVSLNGQTAFERETAGHALKTLDGATDKPLSQNMLDLLELIGMSVEEWKVASEER
jgi:hypothetical protein